MTRPLLERLLTGEDLTVDEGRGLLATLTDAEVAPALKAGLLVALRAKGEAPEELCGMALQMRAEARSIEFDRSGAPLVDTCGTGGDGSDTINISTAASLVVAAAGAKVVKHGNRSVSSRSGSADVLEALGVAMPTGAEAASQRLARAGWTFLFAPVFHPAMKAVVPVRRALGVRTVFNMLGPLTNPAAPPYQVIGAFSVEASALMAEAAAGLPIEKIYVVHGAPGWDEATPVGPFQLWEVRPGRVEHREVDPRDRYGIERCAPEDLRGGDADDNAAALRAVFQGARGAHRDAIVLNAALALEVCGLAEGRGAVERAQQAIDDGSVTALLASLATDT